MATKKPLDANAEKVLATLNKELAKPLEDDKRSAVARLCTVVLLKAANATVVRKALAAIEARFCDWNDVRISEKRDVLATLKEAGIEDASLVADDLRIVLSDLYQQYNVTNFDFGELSVEIFARPAPIDGEAVDVPTIRDEGLPQHESITGFLDGERLLRETSLLDPALIAKKNDERVLMSVYDNPTRTTAKIVWAVGIALGLLQADLLPFEALPKLRSMFGEEQIRFVALALLYYERNSRAVEKFFKQQREPEELLSSSAPFSVQLGFTDEDDHQGGFEPLMPRSEGIGRASKRAKPKITQTKASQARASAASKRRPAVPSPESAEASAAAAPLVEALEAEAAKKPSGTKKRTSTKVAKTTPKQATAKVAKKATKKVVKKAAKSTTTKASKASTKKVTKKAAKKTSKKPTKKAAKKPVK